MRTVRRCSRNGCSRVAAATLTYVYAESTAVVGPLAIAAEPHTYDLCALHARTLTTPRGWELVRPEGDFETPPPSPDDLAALADAVAEPRALAAGDESPVRLPGSPTGQLGRRGHLRVVPNP